MNLLMISGDRSVLSGKRGAFYATLNELVRHFDHIDVICPYVENKGEGVLAIDGVEFHPSPHGLLRQPWWILIKGRQLHAVRALDVMTVHEYPPFYNGFGAAKLASACGIPYALEIHHIVGYPRASSSVEWIGKWMSRVYLAHDAMLATAVRVVNSEVKKILTDWSIPTEKIEVVPSFYLDAELLKPNPQAIKRYDISFCARLVANKGLLNVIRAVGTLPSATLLVIGDGPEKYAAKRLVRELQLDERVTFVGWLPAPADVIAAIQSSKVFIMNSASEGGPRVALEAMACGMPIIATKVGVMPDVLCDGENGVWTTGFAPDVAEKLSMLLADDGLRGRLGEQARGVIDQFAKRTSIERYAEFLKGISRTS